MRRLLTTILSIPLLAGALVALAVVPAGAVDGGSSTVFVNELHYDNDSGDVGEFVEVAGPAGTDLAGWSIELYNGNGGGSYGTISLSGTLADAGEGYGVLSVARAGIQNGAPDGLALVDPSGTVVQFLSYEGVFAATDGPASGLTSTDIGVLELGNTPIGQSVQLTGTGTTAGDFTWTGPAAESPGAVNAGQSFGGGGGAPGDPVLNELGVSDASADDEFVEVLGDASTDYSAFTALQLESDPGGNPGQIDAVVAVGTTDAGGLWVSAVGDLGLENGSATFLLVEGFTGADDDDLDTNDDGTFDVEPWSRIVDAVAIDDAGGVFYGAPVLDESFDDARLDNPFAPGGLSRIPDGADTDTAADWYRNDFSWDGVTNGSPEPGEALNTPGAPNEIVPGPAPTVFISEIHYDNVDADVGEFVEVEGDAGTDLTGWTLVPYNGNGGVQYSVTALSGVIDDEAGGQGAVSFAIGGLQNGAPDGVALVDPSDTVVEFLSYEGSFDATNGPAAGLTSVDIGVSETNTTPIGQSLQLLDGVWTGPAAESPGVLNSGDGGGGPGGDVTIMEIQGSGDASPLVGQEVTTTGVVTRLGGEGGFYLQDPDGDGDPATSDGIFVFTPGTLGDGVAVGDAVEVSGTVAEFFEATQVSASAVTVTGTGSVAPTPVDLAAVAGALEPFEHMLVATGTLFAGDVFNFLQFGEVRSFPELPLQPTEVLEPGPAAAQRGADLNASSILVEDGVGGRNNPTFPFLVDDAGDVRLVKWGDTVSGDGIITFTFGNYKLLPLGDPFTTGDTFQPTNPRPTSTPDPGGSITAASFNTLNLWTNDGGQERGARTQEQYDIQLAKLVEAVLALDADVLALQELQNDPAGDAASATDFNVGKESAEALADAVNAALGVDRYEWIDTGVIGTDAIKVGFIYDQTAVTPVGAPIIVGLDDPAYQPDRNRPSVVQGFEENATGEQFTAVSIHFKSKSGSELDDPGGPCVDGDPSTDVPDCDQGDGAGFFNPARTAAAEVLAAFLADPANLPDPDVLVLGDFNAYTMEDPVDVFVEDNGYSNLGKLSAEGVSFVFFGLGGNLDHAVSNASLTSQVTGAEVFDINGTESANYSYFEGDFPGQLPVLDEFRSSDHSPVIVGLALSSGPGPVVYECGAETFSEADLIADGFSIIIGTDRRDFIRGTNGNDFIFSGRGRDVVDGRRGDDIICTGDGRDLARGGDGDDRIFLGDGRDLALAGNGDDFVDGGAGRDIADGGRGTDTAVSVEIRIRFEN
ncbi:MAG: ExeM/NucH family extracellular endonuclease [Actinomycetota bacterium]